MTLLLRSKTQKLSAMSPEQTSCVIKMNFTKLQEIYQNLSQKIRTLHAKPYAIAAGFACGAAISMTPFVGFHLILAALTALILRASVVASALGTVIGNPWTFALIWPTTLYVGRFMLHQPLEGKTNFLLLFENMSKALFHADFELLLQDVWPVLYPMIVGCIPFYIVVWFISYIFIKHFITKRR